jgi:hypothetical protein
MMHEEKRGWKKRAFDELRKLSITPLHKAFSYLPAGEGSGEGEGIRSEFLLAGIKTGRASLPCNPLQMRT